MRGARPAGRGLQVGGSEGGRRASSSSLVDEMFLVLEMSRQKQLFNNPRK